MIKYFARFIDEAPDWVKALLFVGMTMNITIDAIHYGLKALLWIIDHN